MDWPPISKSSANLPVQPNLVDYDKARAVFSWEAIRKELGGLPNGGLNIAHEAVDRHAAGPRRDHLASTKWSLTSRLAPSDAPRVERGYCEVARELTAQERKLFEQRRELWRNGRLRPRPTKMSTPCEDRRRALPEGKSLPANPGTVVSVRGSVVEAQFEHHPPCINSVLRAGRKNQIVIEVLAQSEGHRVRGIALTPTEGLARGTAVEDTGGPLHAPVGKGTLSRMFDVFGNPIDRGGELRDVEWRPIHRAPPSLARRVAKSETRSAETISDNFATRSSASF